MKMKLRWTFALFLLVQLSFGQRIEISGKVSDEVRSVTLQVFNEQTLAYDKLQKVDVDKGSYNIELATELPNLFKLDFAGKEIIRLSFSDERDVKVNYVNGKVEIIGSTESEAIQSFEAENGRMQAKYFGQLKKDADEAMASGDQEAMKAIQDRSAKAIQEFLVELRQWITDQGEGPAGYYALQFSDFTKELAFIETRLAAFQQKIPDSPVTKALERQVYRSKVVGIGEVPPAIAAVDRAGKPFDLDQYKGKVLLMDFWAAWCRACRIENPQFVKVYEEHRANGFEIVSISQDETKEALEKAIKKDGVEIWRHIWDKDEAISDSYSVSSLPQNVVLDREGKIIAKNVNAEQLREVLAKHL